MFSLIKNLTAKLRSLFFLIIFPKRCLGCGAFDSYFCVDCQKNLEFLFSQEEAFGLWVYSIFSYKEEGIAPLIHAFKYGALMEVFKELENILLNEKNRIAEFLVKGNIYYLPVPLHKKRLRERGYNQSEKLAKIWQKISSGEIVNNLVIRHKYNKAQAKLGRKERLKNLKGIFDLNDFDFSQIRKTDYLILVDDVMTTGATLGEIYELLKDKWPGKIVGLVLARD